MIFLNKTLKKNDFQKNGFITPFYQFDKYKILIIITLGTIVLQEEMMNKEHVKETMDVQIKEGKMEYLVVLAIILVVIARILNSRRKKQPLRKTKSRLSFPNAKREGWNLPFSFILILRPLTLLLYARIQD